MHLKRQKLFDKNRKDGQSIRSEVVQDHHGADFSQPAVQEADDSGEGVVLE